MRRGRRHHEHSVWNEFLTQIALHKRIEKYNREEIESVNGTNMYRMDVYFSDL